MPSPAPLDVVRRRLAAQGLGAGPGFPDATVAVRHLLAVQAQEWAECRWGLSRRVPGATESSIQAEQDAGALVRTHVLRPTWHLVAREDLRWLTRLTGPRVLQGSRGRRRQLGLDQPTLTRAADVMARTVERDGVRTRDELKAALTDAGIDPAGQRMPYLLLHAELELVLCSGPRQGAHHGYALADATVPAAAERDREEAIADLARRFVLGHGPVAPADLAWWSGLTLTDVRRGLHAAGDALEERDGLWSDPSAPEPAARTGAGLIGVYDELHVAFPGGRFAPAAGAAPEPFDRVALLDGRAVGLWRRELTARSVRVEVRLQVESTKRLARELEREAGRLATFLGRTLELRVQPA